MTVWEELARFPSGAHPGSTDPIVTIHMLRGDPSGRSFYIRGGVGTAFHNVEAMVNNNVISRDAADELEVLKPGFDGIEDCRRMYFWLTGPQLSTAVRSLGRLKSLVKRPPTLAKRSGVPQTQLRMISSWMQQLDVIANQQQGATSVAAQNEHIVAVADEEEEEEEAGDQDESRQQQGPQPSPSPSTTKTTTTTTTTTSGVSAAATAAAVAGTAAVQQQQENGRLSVSGAVSATAAAVYRDRRFHISFPCIVTVGASVALSCSAAAAAAATSSSSQGNGVEAAVKELSARATHDAKIIAEDVARRTVDRVGRRNLEEAICESLIRNVRTQRAKIKADAHADRDQRLRRLKAIQAQPLIQKAVEHATARGGLRSAPLWEESSRRSGSTMSSTDSDSGGGGGGAALSSTSVMTSSIAAAAAAGSDGECEDTAASSSAASGGGAAAMKGSVNSTTTTTSTKGSGSGAPPSAPGRVTIADLESLLNSSSAAVHHSSERAPVDQFKVTIADLPDLLQAPPQQQQQQPQHQEQQASRAAPDSVEL